MTLVSSINGGTNKALHNRIKFKWNVFMTFRHTKWQFSTIHSIRLCVYVCIKFTYRNNTSNINDNFCAQLLWPANQYASCTTLMDNALLSNRNPHQNFTAYNEKQLRFGLLAEKLITPTSSMRTRMSRFTHKKINKYDTSVEDVCCVM